ncbi:DSBA oxidoreductase [Halocalculus aciditolerans]|uniref:DSBA oxidoreductase n=2 Tax=Halocalculus aciditolerans TaxID=1383812 RepID=A0A830FQG1_9EURY|nr:DSBA oxidoreductase [Halocalculus aciditolerans]
MLRALHTHMSLDDDALTVFSDYVCPFCYLGRASLQQYRATRDEPLDVTWHAFDLRGHKRDEHGEIREDVDDGKDDDYFEEVRENVQRLSEEYGVDIDFDAVPDIDSWNAQQAALYVREETDAFAAFDDALFEAYWTDYRDIGDVDVLADVAGDVDGVAVEAVRDAATSDEWEARLESEFEEAKQLGITGVPTFAYDGHAARGAVPPEQLERLVEAA